MYQIVLVLNKSLDLKISVRFVLCCSFIHKLDKTKKPDQTTAQSTTTVAFLLVKQLTNQPNTAIVTNQALTYSTTI